MIVYLDSNLFVFAALDTGAKGTLAREILKKMQDGLFFGFTSSLTFDELTWVVRKEKGAESSIEIGNAFLNMSALAVKDVSRNTIFEALTAMKELDLKPRDAIHYAVMKENNIGEIVSEDKDFDKIKRISVYSLNKFRKMLK